MKTWLNENGEVVVLLPLIFAIAFGACGGGRVPPDVSPEGKVAIYGDQFLAGVEEAQKLTIALTNTGTFTRADVEPAIRGFVAIGRGGRVLADALDVIDKSTVTADRMNAAAIAKAALESFDSLLDNVLKDVQSQAIRDRIAQILQGVQLARRFLDLWQMLAPLFPQPKPIVQGVNYGGWRFDTRATPAFT